VGRSEKNVESIFLVLATPELGGTELQVAKMAREFQKNGISTKVIILNRSGPINEVLSQFGIETHNFSLFTWNPLISVINYMKFLMLIKNEKPNILYSFLPRAIIASFTFHYMAKHKTLLVAGIRGTSRKRSQTFEFILNLCLRKSDLIICNTELLVQEVINRWTVEKEKCFVIHNGVDIPDAVADCGKSPAQAIVVANFLPYKGYKNLLDALSKADNRCKYVFCGHGTVDQIQKLEAMIVSYNLADVIELKVNVTNIQDLILSSQFAIHPSLQEGLSNAILEEIACGLPVVAFDVGGNSELIVNGYNGFLTQRLDYDALTNAIEELSKDDLMRIGFGENSRKIAKRFNFKTLLEQYLNLFEESYQEKFN